MLTNNTHPFASKSYESAVLQREVFIMKAEVMRVLLLFQWRIKESQLQNLGLTLTFSPQSFALQKVMGIKTSLLDYAFA